MAKKVVLKEIEEIKKALAEGKVVLGTERTLKSLRLGNIEKVFLTSNCPADVKEQVEHLAKLSKASITEDLGPVARTVPRRHRRQRNSRFAPGYRNLLPRREDDQACSRMIE